MPRVGARAPPHYYLRTPHQLHTHHPVTLLRFLNEQCHVFNECGYYDVVPTSTAVMGVEYCDSSFEFDFTGSGERGGGGAWWLGKRWPLLQPRGTPWQGA